MIEMLQQLEKYPVCGKNSNAITLFPVLTSSSLAPLVMSHIYNGAAEMDAATITSQKQVEH